jgi:hypothetical protein
VAKITIRIVKHGKRQIRKKSKESRSNISKIEGLSFCGARNTFTIKLLKAHRHSRYNVGGSESGGVLKTEKDQKL